MEEKDIFKIKDYNDDDVYNDDEVYNDDDVDDSDCWWLVLQIRIIVFVMKRFRCIHVQPDNGTYTEPHYNTVFGVHIVISVITE